MKKLVLAIALALTFGAQAQEILRTPAGTAQTVAYTGTAGSTSTFPAGYNSVMLFCTTQCYVTVGEGVTATTSDTPLPANVPIWLPVPRGTGAPWRVSAIQQSSGGSVFARPFN